MNNLKTAAKVLTLIAGIFETAISFIFYWTLYTLVKSGSGLTIFTPLIVLFIGLLGGVILIIGSCFLRSNDKLGQSLLYIGSGMSLFTTIYLIVVCTLNGNGETLDSLMLILPFFIVPNALVIASYSMVISINKNQNKKEEIKPQIEDKPEVDTDETSNK